MDTSGEQPHTILIENLITGATSIPNILDLRMCCTKRLLQERFYFPKKMSVNIQDKTRAVVKLTYILLKDKKNFATDCVSCMKPLSDCNGWIVCSSCEIHFYYFI